ncbi:conserved protein of unknown function (plasmid) [Paraburkholderia kururiensis]|uniref:hypothetical protein n=1 Tax=Paraburkholderia kururiensis TaxID=984307 RepID=UPI0039A62951
MNRRVVHHIMLAGESGDAGSLLEKLNDAERRALDEWARTQPREDGVVDLMRWHGWHDVALRMHSDMETAWGRALEIIDRVKSRGPE